MARRPQPGAEKHVQAAEKRGENSASAPEEQEAPANAASEQAGEANNGDDVVIPSISLAKQGPPSPFEAFFRVSVLVQRNPQLFRTEKAAYYFIERHASILASRGAVVRLGESHRAPILVHEPSLLKVCREWASQ